MTLSLVRKDSPHQTCPASIIIVNWNAGELLQRCVSSLVEQTVPPLEVIVFDNASTDGSAERIARTYPFLRIIESDQNVGFATANNLAAQQVSDECKWLVFLNPDAFPAPEWLNSLMEAANSFPQYACFGSRLMAATSTSIVDGVGDVYHISGLVWRSGHGKILSDVNLDVQEIFTPCAAAAMYRKEVFLASGGFDQDFFCYIEDVDIGFRIRLLGHRCLYVPDSVALHAGSAVTGRRSDFSIYHGHRNLVWAYIKNMPGMLLWMCLPLHLALNLGSIFYFAARGQTRVILRAKWDAIKGIPKMWRKRRAIQSRRVVSVRELWRMLDKRLVPMRRG